MIFSPEWETAGIVGLVAILVFIMVLIVFEISGKLANQQMSLIVSKVGSTIMLNNIQPRTSSLQQFLSDSMMYLWAPLFFQDLVQTSLTLNLQNLTLSSTNLYIRPAGVCIELCKHSLSGRYNVQRFFFFFFPQYALFVLIFFFFFFDKLDIKIEAFSLC